MAMLQALLAMAALAALASSDSSAASAASPPSSNPQPGQLLVSFRCVESQGFLRTTRGAKIAQVSARLFLSLRFTEQNRAL